MDPISQAVLGSAFAQSSPQAKSKMPLALVAGMIGGMAPDLDVLIQSKSDPLLAIEFHRHFTHSLFFIPFGGALVGVVLYLTLGSWARRKSHGIGAHFGNGFGISDWILFSTLGLATHGLLDACTSYGTQLLWPFSSLRVAWNNVGIIDPVPTMAWLIGSVFAYRLKSVKAARIGFILGCLYLLFGVVQRERAEALQTDLLSERGHAAVRREVKPTIFQIHLWKSIYEFEGRYYSDAIYVGLFSTRVYPSKNPEGLGKFVAPSIGAQRTTMDSDLERFSWFSDGWLARVPKHETDGQTVVGDVRYSLLPNEIDPLWGIQFHPDQPEAHVSYITFREVTDHKFSIFRKMLLGQDID